MSRSVLVTLCAALATLGLASCARIQPAAGPGNDSCPLGTRYCRRSTLARCVRADFWCDGVQDCLDPHDEASCSQCGPNGFACDGKCVRSVYRCDGQRDCQDGADESGCGPEYRLLQCLDGSFRREEAICDGVWDCWGDEETCSGDMCQGGAVWCRGRCRRMADSCQDDGQTASTPHKALTALLTVIVFGVSVGAAGAFICVRLRQRR